MTEPLDEPVTDSGTVVDGGAARGPVDDGEVGGHPRSRQRSLLALAALLGLYLVIVAAGDARAASGSDAGGKVATVTRMVDSSSWDPDVGYWALAADPDAEHHPLVKTGRYGDRFVQVTSLPMIYVAVPLWRLGGPHLALLVPMAGGVAAAWGARRLARSLGARDGWGAFWLVGAGSPVVFYVADLWEHAPAIGLFVLGLSVLLEPSRASVGGIVAAGVAVGAATAMRAELGLYLVAFALAGAVVSQVRSSWLARRAPLVVAGVAAASVVAANTALEWAVLSAGVQGTRVGDQLGSAGADLAGRARDAGITSVGLLPSAEPDAVVFGLVVSLGLAGLGTGLRHRRAPVAARVGAAVAVVGYLTRLLDGLGFVPGTLPAAPMAPAGIVEAGRSARHRVLAATALGAPVVVWAVQWRGDLVPQWGGRYTLCSAVLLTVLAAVGAEAAGWSTWGARLLVGLTVVVSAFGLAWHIDRTRTVANAFEAIGAEVGDGVLVTTFPHLPREGGAWYDDQRWLVTDGDGIEDAVRVARAMGATRVGLVEPRLSPTTGGEPVAGYQVTGTSTVPWLSGTELVVTWYEGDR